MRLHKNIFDGKFGLERETLRVDTKGRLSQTSHPFQDKQLERDFCENQLEIITLPCDTISEMLSQLKVLDEKARAVLREQNETLWLNSNPPYIENEDEIPVARYSGDKAAKHNYRLKLQRRYGKRLMLHSGIHFNFSFSEDYLKSLYEKEGAGILYRDFKDRLYLHLSKMAIKYSWLLVLLTSASPIYDLSLDGDGLYGTGFDGYASIRNGRRGYWNQFVPILDYSDTLAYVKSIENYINKGMLFSAGELYLPVRLKPKGENSLDALVRNGINHIELRMFDINHLEPFGIAEKDLEFAHLLLLYLSSLAHFEFTAEQQADALKNHKSAALFDIYGVTIDGVDIRCAAQMVMNKMCRYFQEYNRALNVIEYERAKLQNKRICEKIYEMARSEINV